MNKLLQVSSLFDYNKIEYNKFSEVHLDIILNAPKCENSKRTPLSISLAIDCSGSMNGSKIESVKKSAEKLIQHLTENDTLSILGFSNTAFEVFKAMPMTQTNKDTAKKAIKNLHTLSSTNISAALEMASEMVLIADKNILCRTILLTDGLPNIGLSTQEQLVEMVSKINPRISLSTFGYGSDYDPELLLSLANMGKGNHFYIKEDEDCNKAFAMELGGLLSLYAQNIKLTVTPSKTMEFKELLSEYKCEQKQGYRLITGQKIEIQIDDIFAGEKKHVVLKLAVPQATEAVCARDTRVCSVAISYTDIETKALNSTSFNSFVQYVKPDKAPKTPNEDVQRQILLLEAAKFQKEAQDKADQGQYDEAQKILSNGLSFVHLNERLMENAPAVANMFSNLQANFSDAHTYRSKGTKLAASYRCSLSSNRGTSADTLSYASSGQADMLAQFMKEPDSEKKEDEK